MEPRLDKRYRKLVRAHMHVGHCVAAGVTSFLDQSAAFSQTQAAWRFLNNSACTLPALAQPLLNAVHAASNTACDNFILIPHDWSNLGFNKHTRKKDTFNTFKKCIGYELQSSLAVSDRNGAPLGLANGEYLKLL